MSGGFRSRSKSGDPADRGHKGQDKKRRYGTQKRASARDSTRSTGGRRNDRVRHSDPLIQAARRSGVDVPRAVAFDVLRRVAADDAFANLTLPKALSANNLSGRDAAFATELTYGTLRTEGVLLSLIHI